MWEHPEPSPGAVRIPASLHAGITGTGERGGASAGMSVLGGWSLCSFVLVLGQSKTGCSSPLPLAARAACGPGPAPRPLSRGWESTETLGLARSRGDEPGCTQNRSAERMTQCVEAAGFTAQGSFPARLYFIASSASTTYLPCWSSGVCSVFSFSFE